jgi:type IV pilus assembly protein PilB
MSFLVFVIGDTAVKNCKRLGDLLLDTGYITQEQLEKALSVQNKTRERLSHTLINLGYITETAVLNLLEAQLGVKRIDLIPAQVDKTVASLIPRALAEKYQIIPFAKQDNVIVLVMADPTNFFAIDDVRMITGSEVKPVIATEREVAQAINDIYRSLSVAKPCEEVVQPASPSGEEAPVASMINTIISQAIREQASDIHLEPQEKEFRIRLRIDGILREIASFPRHTHAATISRIKILSEMDIAEKRVPQDGRIKVIEAGREVDIRVSTLPTIFGEKVVMRILDKQAVVFDINLLGLAEETLERYRHMYYQPYGMILVTGPTGSGKTTTLYSTLSALNTVDRNIITVEDPVEYQLDGINQVQVNPKAGINFANGLRSILRQDPNVIMVGEIRDVETTDIAIRAALTGHLVFSTLHTNDAAGAITRLLDMGAAPFLVASSVLGVVAQRLVRKICPDCRERYWLPAASPERLYLGLRPDEPVILYRGRGCPLCSQTGYKGRLAIHEIMPLTSAIRQLINRRADRDAIAACAIREGMATMSQDGFTKAMAGLTTVEEIRRVACDSG